MPHALVSPRVKCVDIYRAEGWEELILIKHHLNVHRGAF